MFPIRKEPCFTITKIVQSAFCISHFGSSYIILSLKQLIFNLLRSVWSCKYVLNYKYNQFCKLGWKNNRLVAFFFRNNLKAFLNAFSKANDIEAICLIHFWIKYILQKLSIWKIYTVLWEFLVINKKRNSFFHLSKTNK